VPRAPRIASTRKNGARRTIDPVKDLQAMTQDQSPASALQWFPRNFRTETLRRTETASRFAAPSTRRHLGRDFASGSKKRSHAIPIKTGGENTENTLRIVNNPFMIREYASEGRLGPISLLRQILRKSAVVELQVSGHRVCQACGLVRALLHSTPTLAFCFHR
jgi:hypothetical protein